MRILKGQDHRGNEFKSYVCGLNLLLFRIKLGKGFTVVNPCSFSKLWNFWQFDLTDSTNILSCKMETRQSTSKPNWVPSFKFAAHLSHKYWKCVISDYNQSDGNWRILITYIRYCILKVWYSWEYDHWI